jgi:F0F1-type ATP synthase assembly protein I
MRAAFGTGLRPSRWAPGLRRGTAAVMAHKRGTGEMESEPRDEQSGTSPAEQQRRQQAAAYQGAMEAIFSIVIATGAGYWADDRFGTSPVYLLLGAVVGFGAFVMRIMRMRPPDAGTSEAGKVEKVEEQLPDSGRARESNADSEDGFRK